DVRGHENDFTVGAAYSVGDTTYNSITEVASLLENLGTTRTGIFAAQSVTSIDSQVTTQSIYFGDTFSLTPRSALTAAGRYDTTRIRLSDRTAENPELNGSHDFDRFNPSVGLPFRTTPEVKLSARYSESARAPTAVELACASADAP